MTEYTQKMVISGNIVEFYQFQKSVQTGFQKTTEEIREKSTRLLNAITWQKSQFSLTRTRRNIRRLINSNPAINKFMTLTFADNVVDIDVANYEFKKFIERLKYAYPHIELKYLSVIEFQKRGAVHYHILLNVPTPDLKSKELREKFEVFFAKEYWRNGFVDVKDIDKVDNLGAYVSKYLSKESTERLFNKKKFFCSQNLERPFQTVDKLCIDNLIEMYKLKNIKPTYEIVIENEFSGKILYYQFRLCFDT